MRTSNEKFTTNIAIFIVSFVVIGIITSLSLLTAYAYDEGTLDNVFGRVGYYSFYVLRSPAHNLIWLKPELIDRWFLPGLFFNICIYSFLTTLVLSMIRNRKEGKTASTDISKRQKGV